MRFTKAVPHPLEMTDEEIEQFWHSQQVRREVRQPRLLLGTICAGACVLMLLIVWWRLAQ